MKPKVYLETSVLSYLAARPNRDLIRAANQQITREWWELRRPDFELFISQIVIKEISAGDPDAAAKRLGFVEKIPILDIEPRVESLAETLCRNLHLPARAALDSLHIALAVFNGMDFLLSWNCKHIANAQLLRRIEELCQLEGHKMPVVCTPPELLEVLPDVSR